MLKEIEAVDVHVHFCSSWECEMCVCMHACLSVYVLLVLGLVLILFLHFHPPVLEPDLHLPLCQIECARHLMSPIAREVHVEQELLLQL